MKGNFRYCLSVNKIHSSHKPLHTSLINTLFPGLFLSWRAVMVYNNNQLCLAFPLPTTKSIILKNHPPGNMFYMFPFQEFTGMCIIKCSLGYKIFSFHSIHTLRVEITSAPEVLPKSLRQFIYQSFLNVKYSIRY